MFKIFIKKALEKREQMESLGLKAELNPLTIFTTTVSYGTSHLMVWFGSEHNQCDNNMPGM